MLTLKQIAARMDCHPKTAKRWWKKLNVPPDVFGHGPHKWHEDTADRLVKRYNDFYAKKGTTAQIVRLKYAGDLYDPHQIFLFPINQPHVTKTQSNQRPRPNGNPPASLPARRGKEAGKPA
jgi:hypothetical protein